MTCSGTTPWSTSSRRWQLRCWARKRRVFLPSGTMGNVVGVAVNTRLGEEIIADADSHVFLYETAGAAVIAGVQIRPVATAAGVMTPSQIEAALRPRDDFHQPITAAVSFEDTHNRHGGIVWPLERLARSVGGRQGPRPPRSPRRGEDLQRLGGVADRRRGHRGLRRHGDLLPLERPRLPGGKRVLRQRRLGRAGSPLAQAAGRRDAPGRRHRGDRA